jgi:putative DNA primase/helicase
MVADVPTRLTRAYLDHRGVLGAVPDRCLPDTLKDGDFPFGPGCTTAGMLALIRNILTDEPQAVHRTALTPNGAKATINGMSRMSLGPLDGGAIKLSADGDVETCLGIAEGIETALSMRLLPGCEALPVWSLISAGQLAQFPVLAGVSALWIGVDNDPAGRAAAEAVTRRWQAAGVDVVTVMPTVARTDLNDLVRVAHAP